jgi:hypothetical protein
VFLQLRRVSFKTLTDEIYELIRSNMKFNRKYFFGVLVAIGMQVTFGASSANAVPCENLLKAAWDEAPFYTVDFDHDKGLFRKGDRVKEIAISAYPRWVIAKTYEDALRTFPSLPINFSEYFIKNGGVARCVNEAESIYSYESTLSSDRNKLKACLTNYLIQNKCDVSTFKNSGSARKASQNSSSSSSSDSSNQTNSGRADNQSSANQSNQSGASYSNNQSTSQNSYANTSSSNQSTQQGNANANGVDNGLNMSPEQTAFVNQATQMYATKTAAFNESHQGLKRTHNQRDEATKCLAMKGTQIVNTCDFKLEYMFCAYKPDQKAFRAAFEMAAAFDCDKGSIGMAGMSAKSMAAGTFTADVIYVFGCKEPSMPTGVTYQRGRGLSGWCAE